METYTLLKALKLLISKMEESRAKFDFINRYLEKTPYFPQNIV